MRIHKNMNNTEIAELLRAVAAAYQIKDEEKNRFKIIAYQRAADAIEHSSSEVKDLWDEGKLEELAGIGKSIAEHLDEIFKKGTSKHFEEILKGLPAQMFDLMTIPGIGAKTAYKLVKSLNISSNNPISQLEEAAKKGKIAKIPGFKEESQRDILRSIEEIKGRTKRHLLPYAQKVAQEIVEWLLKSKEVKKAEPLGSLRRRASTVGDIDIAVSTEDAEKVIDHFVKFPKVIRVLEKGKRTSSIIIPGDIQIDLMVQPPDRFGALLQHFTGSKHHNIALREFALKKGYSLSEYGIRKRGTKGLKKFATEEEFYNFLGLAWIPPELREDSGEIEAALNSFQNKPNGLPNLIKLEDIKGDLQIHSDFDIETSHDLGSSSMEELILKANDLGYEYIAFTEHNPSQSHHSQEQIINLLEKKKEKVEQLNYSFIKSLKGSIKKVFNCLEIDIKPDGSLPIPEKGFEKLDFALVSIHSSFRQDRKTMTQRIIRALEHPKVKIFAHPTARLLNQREGIEVDWEKIFNFMVDNNKWVEINADPARLDLPDFLVREAIKYGVKLTLGTDSHHRDHLDNMEFGVSVARRGWAEKKDIVNTRSLKEFEKMLEL